MLAHTIFVFINHTHTKKKKKCDSGENQMWYIVLHVAVSTQFGGSGSANIANHSFLDS